MTSQAKALAYNKALNERYYARLQSKLRRKYPVSTPVGLVLLALYKDHLENKK